MTTEEWAQKIANDIGIGGNTDTVDRIAKDIATALKDQRRQIHDRILLSPLANKDEVTAVIFPSTATPVKQWVDLSKDG